MPIEQRHLKAKDRAVADYLRGPYKTYKTPPGLGRNVIGIGIGHKNNDPNSDPCVHCYVERKLEPGAVPEGFLIKQTLGSVQTDVIETGRFIAFQDNVAEPGSLLGLNYKAPNVDPTITGTLSAFVRIGGAYYVLGSNHAMTVNGRVPPGTEILFKLKDKFTDPSKQIFARTTVHVPLSHDYPNSVDCALAQVDNPNLIETDFPGRIVDSHDPIDPALHMKVSIVGDDATGLITAVNVRMRRIDYRFGSYEFDDLILIEGDQGPFAAPGQSGALVVDQGTKRATALVIGGSNKYTIACPLAAAFQELEKELAKRDIPSMQVNALEATPPPPRIELIVDPWRDPKKAGGTSAGGSES